MGTRIISSIAAIRNMWMQLFLFVEKKLFFIYYQSFVDTFTSTHMGTVIMEGNVQWPHPFLHALMSWWLIEMFSSGNLLSVCVRVCLYVRVCVHVCVHVYLVCIGTCMCVCVFLCTCICACMYVYVHVVCVYKFWLYNNYVYVHSCDAKSTNSNKRYCCTNGNRSDSVQLIC